MSAHDNRNVTISYGHGRQMPRGWEQEAQQRKIQAETEYMNRLENAWRGSLTKTNDSVVHNARLTKDSAYRADSMRMVRSTDDWEEWTDDSGIRVVRRKHGK